MSIEAKSDVEPVWDALDVAFPQGQPLLGAQGGYLPTSLVAISGIHAVISRRSQRPEGRWKAVNGALGDEHHRVVNGKERDPDEREPEHCTTQ